MPKPKTNPGPTQPYPKSATKQVKPASFNGVTVNVHGKKRGK